MSSSFCKKSDKYLTQSDIQEELLKHGNDLKIIKLGSFFDSRILISIRNYCQNVKHLELELMRYTPTHLNQAFANMKNLKSIVVRNLEIELLENCTESLPINIEEIGMSKGCLSQEEWERKSIQSVSFLIKLLCNYFFLFDR